MWEKDLRLKLHNVYATIFQLSKYNNKQLNEKEDIIVNFIKDLRKRDEEELIKGLIEPVNEDEEVYKRVTILCIKKHYNK